MGARPPARGELQDRPAPQDMVIVPAGPFTMGSTPEEADPDAVYPDIDYMASSRPQRQIELDLYYIDVHPVTNAEYRLFVEETGYDVPAPGWDQPRLAPFAWDARRRTYAEGLDRYPVVLVSWYDALAYCHWAGKRLPTEAEWEKAARGTDGRPYPWGWEPVSERRCLMPSLGEPDTSPADALRPVDACLDGASPYGCLSMLGTVDEWCADWYDDAYYARMRRRNPSGPCRPRRAPWRSVRGSTVADAAPHLARRCSFYPWDRSWVIGFRCCLTPSGSRSQHP